MADKITIGGSLVPVLLSGIAAVLDARKNPIHFEYTFDADKEELRIASPDDGKVLTSIPY